MTQTKERSKKKQRSIKLTDTEASALAAALPELSDSDVRVRVVPLPITFEDWFGDLKPRRKLKPSRIRIQLNRPLEWGEVNDITHMGLQFKLHCRRLANGSIDKQYLFAEGPMDSRRMFGIVARVLAENYVNVFPRAVRTFSEYSGVVPR